MPCQNTVLQPYFVIAIVISFPVLTSPAYALLMLDSDVFSSDLERREYNISTSSKQHNLDVTWDSKFGSEGWANFKRHYFIQPVDPKLIDYFVSIGKNITS